MYIVLDFETAYASDYSLTKLTYEQYIRDPRFRVHGVGFKVNDQPVEYVYGDAIAGRLQQLFPPGNSHVLIAHNILFDGAILAWVYGLHAGAYYCTEAMSRMLWNQRSASLESLAKSCFPDNKLKRKGKELESFKGILRELTDEEQVTLGRYCRNDVQLTFDCFARMYAWLPDEAFQIMDIMHKMFIDPVFILDKPRVERHLAAVTAERRAKIAESQLPEKVLASNEQFAAWILAQGFDFEKVPSPTPTNPSNMKWPLGKGDTEFLRLRADHPDLHHVWEGRIAAKSTSEQRRAERLLEHVFPDGRIALPLKPSAAHTHRAGGTNKINPQNFKRGSELRKSLCAPPGHLVVVADLSNIERRLLAWEADETSILEAFAQKRDLYCEFATEAYGFTVTKENHPTERFVGKTCELGLGYGVGADKLRQTLASGLSGPSVYFSRDKCQELVNLFRRRNPNTRQLWRQLDRYIVAMMQRDCSIEFKCLNFEYQRIRLPNGLYLNYPDLRAIELPTGGFEFEYHNGKYYTRLYGAKLVENITQAVAQTLLRWHMLQINDRLSNVGGRIALQVHDELVAVVPEQHAEDVLAMMIGVMRIKPDWLTGDQLVLDAEGGIAANYSK